MAVIAPALPTAAPSARAMGVLEAIYQRRPVHAYSGEPIDAEVVRLLLRAAVHAPTTVPREAWSFVVVQDPTLLAELGEKIGARDCPFATAGTVIVICAPALPQVEADCWLAAGNLILAATSLGLGTCLIGGAPAVIAAPDVASRLGIPADVTAIAAIAVGIPRERPPYVARRDPRVLAWR